MKMFDKKKIIQCYEDILKDCKTKFFLTYQMHYYVLEHFKDEHIIKSFNTPWLTEDGLIKLFRAVFDTWTKTINKQLDEGVMKVMSSQSLSQGEAMLIADSAFEEQVGYLNSFITNFQVANQQLLQTVREEGVK